MCNLANGVFRLSAERDRSVCSSNYRQPHSNDREINEYRSNIAAARLQGLEDDLNLQGDQYQTALAIFSVGYTLIQIPSNLALNYVGRPSIYLGFFVVAWGLVSALTSQATNFVGLVVCRVVLGLVGE